MSETGTDWLRCNYCGHRWGPIHFIVHWPLHFSKRYRRWYNQPVDANTNRGERR